MSENSEHKKWIAYCEKKLSAVTPILQGLGYNLDEHQPHLGGERYLMQAVTTESGRKLILIGKNTDGKKVVIKVTDDEAGIQELEHERTCRETLKEIHFAYQVFFTPEEVLYTKVRGNVLSIQYFIEQECPFLERPLQDQFSLALKAFKAQESAHATTHHHQKIAKRTFGVRNADEYIATMRSFVEQVKATLPEQINLHNNLDKVLEVLEHHKETIEQYCGFLTHTDFVPHNFRIAHDNIYLLDHSSIRFGNKYDGWARFLNFMALYNPELEKLLTEYVHNNRTPEEHTSLHAMRLYRLSEIICYYTQTLQKSEGKLKTLNTTRVVFWNDVLKATLQKQYVAKDVREAYVQTRDSLRSNDEKERQAGLH